MAHKGLWDFMDKLEGKPEGSSFSHLQKERKRQGYDVPGKKKNIAGKMKKDWVHYARTAEGRKNEKRSEEQ